MRFEKVSYEQYANSREGVDERVIRTEYDGIKLPKRATTGSAGYDFFSPIEFELRVGDTIKIPTGVKVLLDDDKFLAIYPRSGLGFKYRVQLDNTVGIIDSDYSQSDNEGHIFIKLTNDGKANKSININTFLKSIQIEISYIFSVRLPLINSIIPTFLRIRTL